MRLDGRTPLQPPLRTPSLLLFSAVVVARACYNHSHQAASAVLLQQKGLALSTPKNMLVRSCPFARGRQQCQQLLLGCVGAAGSSSRAAVLHAAPACARACSTAAAASTTSSSSHDGGGLLPHRRAAAERAKAAGRLGNGRAAAAAVQGPAAAQPPVGPSVVPRWAWRWCWGGACRAATRPLQPLLTTARARRNAGVTDGPWDRADAEMVQAAIQDGPARAADQAGERGAGGGPAGPAGARARTHAGNQLSLLHARAGYVLLGKSIEELAQLVQRYNQVAAPGLH